MILEFEDEKGLLDAQTRALMQTCSQAAQQAEGVTLPLSVFIRVTDDDEIRTINREQRISRLFRMHAAKQEPLDEAHAGDIVACVGLTETRTGDTLWALCRTYGLTMQQMLAYNPWIRDPDLIHTGEELRIG